MKYFSMARFCLVATWTCATLAYQLLPGLDTREEAGNPCAKIRDLIDSFEVPNSPGPTDLPTIKPSLAYDCLKSIPFDVERDGALVDFLRPSVQWHSTISFLKDPPKGYLAQGVDLNGGLDEIQRKVGEGEYERQYDFIVDLYTLLQIRQRDAHLRYLPELLKVFRFRRLVDFISVSDDGLSLPRIFVADDVDHETHGYEPSPAKMINGVDASDFIARRSLLDGSHHDPDARYNNYLTSLASKFWARSLLGNTDMLELPDLVKVEFENGTSHEYENVAFVMADFSQVDSGQTLHDLYEVGTGQGGPDIPGFGHNVFLTPGVVTQRVGYPEENLVVAHVENITMGYMFGDGELEDTAVLTLATFQFTGVSQSFGLGDEEARKSGNVHMQYLNHFAEVWKSFLEPARGKKHLIIDLQGNTGGDMFHLFAAYFTLFPGRRTPWRIRTRALPQLEWLGRTYQELADKGLVDHITALPWPYGVKNMVHPDGTQFKSFHDMFGPEEIRGDNYTRPMVYNSTESLLIFGERWNWTAPWSEPPFEPENIAVVTDGYCISACTFFVGALAREQGIRTIVMGGRPIEAPMQAMGGVKGGPTATMAEVDDIVKKVAQFVDLPDDSRFVQLGNSTPPLRSGTDWVYSLGVNQGNVYPMKEDIEVPVHFLYEAANCKLFFTWDMFRDMTAVWEAVAKAAWGGGKCVERSAANEDGTMGDTAVGYSPAVEDKMRLPSGPGEIDESKRWELGSGTGKNVSVEHEQGGRDRSPWLCLGQYLLWW